MRDEDRFNPDLTEERLDELLRSGPAAPLPEVVAELRLMRELYCDLLVQGWVDDDDPEEWQRWAYRSGKPSWFKLPEWFLEENPWMREHNRPDWGKD